MFWYPLLINFIIYLFLGTWRKSLHYHGWCDFNVCEAKRNSFGCTRLFWAQVNLLTYASLHAQAHAHAQAHGKHKHKQVLLAYATFHAQAHAQVSPLAYASLHDAGTCTSMSKPANIRFPHEQLSFREFTNTTRFRTHLCIILHTTHAFAQTHLLTDP